MNYAIASIADWEREIKDFMVLGGLDYIEGDLGTDGYIFMVVQGVAIFCMDMPCRTKALTRKMSIELSYCFGMTKFVGLHVFGITEIGLVRL